MATLYGTFPILLPGKTESVSRNGLQKTSGTILFEPGQDGAALTLAEQNGSVFPDPQIRTTDMGLLEMSFDAYTDTGASTGVFGTEVINLSKSFSAAVFEQGAGAPVIYTWTITEVWLVDSYTKSKVLAAALGSVSLPASTVSLGTLLIKRAITGRLPAGGTSTLMITWNSQVSSVTRRNFGEFDEVDIVSSLSATIA